MRTYLTWERNSKCTAHEKWRASLDCRTFDRLLREGEHAEIAARAVKVICHAAQNRDLPETDGTHQGATGLADSIFDTFQNQAGRPTAAC